MKFTPKDRSGCLDFSVLVTGQLILLLFLTALFIVIDFWPTHVTPFFRYTGSNPDESVWNLGFPIAWFIYDDNTPPNWFMSTTQGRLWPDWRASCHLAGRHPAAVVASKKMNR